MNRRNCSSRVCLQVAFVGVPDIRREAKRLAQLLAIDIHEHRVVETGSHQEVRARKHECKDEI